MKHPIQDLKAIKGPNQCLSYYLIHSYLYYIANKPLISDADFDKICQWLKMAWDQVTHRHKHLVSLKDLNASTGYAIRYPQIVESSAWQVLREVYHKQPKKKLAPKPAKRKARRDKTFEEYDTLFG